jgi:hypothetical protein
MTAKPLPASTAGSPPWRRIVPALLALLLLNGMLSFSTWWPTPGILPDKRLAPEFVGLWLVLLAAVAWRGPLSPRALTALTLAYLLLVLGRYLDVTAPSLFGREVNLYWDGAQIPRFLWVTAQDFPWWISAGVLTAALLLLWGLHRLLRWAIAVTATEVVPHALRSRRAWLATAAATVLVAANYAGVRETWPVVSKPVIPTYWRQADLLLTSLSAQRLQQVLPPSTTLQAALAAPAGRALGTLGGRDVYLIFMESYGAVTYDNPRAVAGLTEARQRFAADIAAGGRQVVSAFISSPTYGGASDLAHLSVLSGLDLSNPMRHDLLLTTDRPTLSTLFRANGYRVFGVYPALSWEWPERAYYGFDEFLQSRELDYRGPPLGYWKIPDQFALARFEQLHPRGADEPPRFVFFPTITCHFPFSPVPPYQPDWQRVLSDKPFDAGDVARAESEQVAWLNMFPDYLRMVEYTYRWLGGFLRQSEPRETVFILLGDHQPTANISGEGASWDVPVHIVARDPALLKRFAEQGFHAGLNPPRQSLGGMHELTAMVLRAFAEPRAPATLVAAQTATTSMMPMPSASLSAPGGTPR